ncbi:MAG: hypothetical protein JO307_20960 [Bryobacterales bacterium]|nr:hypothetical protein [Bryobacterales bacterium]
MPRRKLSNIEHLAEVNIACSARLAGKLDLGDLRTALGHAQRRHPALRALIRPENDVLYYEPDTAPEIPVRALQLPDDETYRREWEFELSTPFHHDFPQLRVAYVEGDCDCELLFTTSHRVCDGLSIFILVKDVLRFLARRVELSPQEEISARDIIGEYRPAWPWLTGIGVAMINTCLRLLPASRPAPRKKEYCAEWSAGREASASLRQQCKAAGVSVHAAFLVALDRALLAVLGARAPNWMTCPIDLRRGRFPVLKDDMLFYGGGNFTVRAGRWIEGDFWDSARRLTQEIRAQVEREVLAIPERLFLFERLRPLTCSQARWLVRASEALQSKRRVKGIGVSNLGNIEFTDTDCPLPVRDIRFSARSLNFGILGLIPYTVNGHMRFYWTGSENFINERELLALKQEFARTLESHIERKWAEAVPA